MNMLDYRSNELIQQQYPLKDPKLGMNTIHLKSYNRDCACMLVYVTKENADAIDIELMYPINRIDLLDP